MSSRDRNPAMNHPHSDQDARALSVRQQRSRTSSPVPHVGSVAALSSSVVPLRQSRSAWHGQTSTTAQNTRDRAKRRAGKEAIAYQPHRLPSARRLSGASSSRRRATTPPSDPVPTFMPGPSQLQGSSSHTLPAPLDPHQQQHSVGVWSHPSGSGQGVNPTVNADECAMAIRAAVNASTAEPFSGFTLKARLAMEPESLRNPKYYRDLDNIMRHLLTPRDDTSPNTTNTENTSTRFACCACSKPPLRTRRGARDHILVSHLGVKYLCSQPPCLVERESEREIRAHEERSHELQDHTYHDAGQSGDLLQMMKGSLVTTPQAPHWNVWFPAEVVNAAAAPRSRTTKNLNVRCEKCKQHYSRTLAAAVKHASSCCNDGFGKAFGNDSLEITDVMVSKQGRDGSYRWHCNVGTGCKYSTQRQAQAIRHVKSVAHKGDLARKLDAVRERETNKEAEGRIKDSMGIHHLLG